MSVSKVSFYSIFVFLLVIVINSTIDIIGLRSWRYGFQTWHWEVFQKKWLWI